MSAPRLILNDVAAFERWTPFARPFRFGAVTVEGAFQAFVRLTVEVEGHGRATGMAAELMPPKWFDKRPLRSADETVDDLRASLRQAVETARAMRAPMTAFALHAERHTAQLAFAGAADITPLSAGFGVALIDKAVLDGLSRALDKSFVDVLRANAVGLDARLTPDLTQAAIDRRLRRLQPAASIALRHTVGLTDAIEGEGGLAAELKAADLSFFKVKLGGDPEADHRRLAAIAAFLAARGIDYRLTVDANEQYAPEALAALIAGLEADAALEALRRRLLFIEQPFDRAVTFDRPLDSQVARCGVIIDEADDAYDAFPRAMALGYRGVSSKSCKGLYKSLLNAARAEAANAGGEERFFLSAEDLTCQAGLAVQQDTALVSALGLTHVERNGHHYVDGFGPAPAAEAEGFLAAHPDLYRRDGDGRVRLAVASGRLATAGLFGPGFAAGAAPDFSSLTPLFQTASEGTSA
jgi:hypothetical protein